MLDVGCASLEIGSMGVFDVNEKLARGIFGESFFGEFSARELLKRYRELSLLKHPDHGGDDNEFVLLTDAFTFLKRLSCEDVDDEKARTVSGEKISDLGKGYPITESAKTCDVCDGNGYRKYSSHSVGTGKYEECKLCGGDGLEFYKCNRCGGTGKYINPNSGKEVGDCYKCKGTGKFYPFKKKSPIGFASWPHGPMFDVYVPGTNRRGVPCKMCAGSGETEIRSDGRPCYMICVICEGVGEVKMWNPVIPRGFLSGGMK